VAHVTDPEQIRGLHVIGPVPLHLAAEAESVVHIPLDIPPELRGVELTLEQVRQFAGPPVEYTVRESSAYLQQLAHSAEIDKVAPGAKSPDEAINRLIGEWADAHGLVKFRGLLGRTHALPGDTAAALELVRLSRLDPPYGGEIQWVGMLDGIPCVRLGIKVAGHELYVSFVPER